MAHTCVPDIACETPNPGRAGALTPTFAFASPKTLPYTAARATVAPPLHTARSKPSAQPLRMSMSLSLGSLPLSRRITWLVALLVAVGLFVRVFPLFEGDDMLLRQPTEDGYLLLTIARNLAIGRGMSTAEGTIPTNGVQPLITFIFAAGYLPVGGDKVAGVRIAMLVSVVIALLGARATYIFAQRVLATQSWGKSAAAISSALWFVGPVSMPHTANALETGLYVAIAMVVLDRFYVLRMAQPEQRTTKSLGVLGAWLGACFWARNDAVFLAAALCGLWFIVTLRGADLKRAFIEPLTIGGVAAIVALPWVAFNFIYFGHPVPVSGRSEGAGATMGGNLDVVGAKLLEYISVVGGVPEALEAHPAVQVVSLFVVALAIYCIVRLYRVATVPQRDA